MPAQFTIDATGVQEVAGILRDYPQKVARANLRSINRAIASARTVMVRAMAADSGLRARDVREALRFQQATVERTIAQLAATLKRIPLIRFNARGPEPSRGQGRGVTYRLRGGRGRIPNAFIATMSSGHRGVFVRVGAVRKSRGAWSKNLAIVEQFGPSLGRIFEKHAPAGAARAEEAYLANLAHELERATQQANASATANALRNVVTFEGAE